MFPLLGTHSLLFSFFTCYVDHRDLHSFPTRRSSDLWIARTMRRLSFPDLAPYGLSAPAHPYRDFLRRRRIPIRIDRKSTRLNSSHQIISYAVFCLKKKSQ